MGVIRTEFSARCRFYVGDNRNTSIRWYLAAEGAPVYYGVNAFSEVARYEGMQSNGPRVGEITSSPRMFGAWNRPPWLDAAEGHPDGSAADFAGLSPVPQLDDDDQVVGPLPPCINPPALMLSCPPLIMPDVGLSLSAVPMVGPDVAVGLVAQCYDRSPCLTGFFPRLLLDTVPVDLSETPLWSQFPQSAADGLLSDIIQGPYSDYSSFAFDNFTVPSSGWSITGVGGQFYPSLGYGDTVTQARVIICPPAMSGGPDVTAPVFDDVVPVTATLDGFGLLSVRGGGLSLSLSAGTYYLAIALLTSLADDITFPEYAGEAASTYDGDVWFWNPAEGFGLGPDPIHAADAGVFLSDLAYALYGAVL